MDNVFELLTKGIKLSWDPEELTKDFKSVTDITTDIVYLPNGEPHWQYFTTGISFSRNFNSAFPNECAEIVANLNRIQDKLKASTDNSTMCDLFVNHTFDINKVLLVKVPSGKSVELHYDKTRDYSINIGLKNSDTCLTHVYSGARTHWRYHGPNLINETNVKNTFRMNDGDAYIIATKQPHCVESLTLPTENKDRYIISYCLTDLNIPSRKLTTTETAKYL